jgi:hypothetical protein
MSIVLSRILTVSLATLLLGVAYLQFRRKDDRRLWSTLVLIGLAAGVFFFLKADTVETKGPADETIAVVFCYLAMLLGMVAEYGYRQAEQGEQPFKFNLRFLMPIFASPIVFIPLLTITTDMSLGGAFTKAKLMVYLVAFQNGFFWKSFFEERLRKPLEGMATLSSQTPAPVSQERSRAATAK